MREALKAEAARFLRFALVGVAGFALDAALLAALHDGFGLDPFSARLVSISIAAFTTWRFNRVLTFGASDRHQAVEGARYATVASLAAGLNYLVYASALILWRDMPPFAALVVGTAVAMGFSYVGYSRFVFASGARAILVSSSSHSR